MNQEVDVVEVVKQELEEARNYYEQARSLLQKAEQRLIEAQATHNFLTRLVIPVEGGPPLAVEKIIARTGSSLS